MEKFMENLPMFIGIGIVACIVVGVGAYLWYKITMMVIDRKISREEAAIKKVAEGYIQDAINQINQIAETKEQIESTLKTLEAMSEKSTAVIELELSLKKCLKWLESNRETVVVYLEVLDQVTLKNP